MSAPALVSRNDIHKSCKTVEAVVNLLNDYSEAVTAIIGIQKKLAKALRDAASAKIASEVAANALNASATIFDTLGDVDMKFAKLVDSECEGVSNEVKKWFKRLAKEERQHDQKLASANDKVKQAGGYYERKVKKNPADAVEEHTRYINLLTTVGHDTNQEKYDHSLMVNQRQGETLFSLASSLSRVADGQWLRVCEELRRVSPNIGQVGEWRVLAESNWIRPIPPPLPEIEDSSGPRIENGIPVKKVIMDGLVPPESVGTPAPEYASRAVTPTDSSSHPPTYFSPARQATPDVSASPEPENSRDRSLSVNSLASLGSFPSPPAHFPLPPILPSNNLGNARHQSSHSAGLSSSSPQLQPHAPVSSPERLSTPTVAAPGRSGKDSATFFDFASPPASPTTHAHDATSNRVVTVAGHADDNPGPVQDKGKEPVSDPDRPQRSNLTSPAPDATKSRTYPIGDYVNDAEFGARRAPSVGPSTSPSLPRSVERSDTNRSSNSSVVAAMRDKYSRSTGPASPPPKDIPRLPLSVSNLATRYDNSAPGERTNPESPSPESNRMSTDIRCQPSSSNQSCSPQDSTSSDIVRRRQRIQELEELELREREYAFRMKEKEIREQARELEREQFELMEARQTRVRADSTASLMRLRGAVAGRPESYAEPTTPVHDQPHPYASSTNGPNSPPTPRYLSQYSSPPSHMLTQPLHHNTSRDQLPSPGVIRPAEPTPSSRPEKPKGNWIRRLSMPVMSNAFSDNGKKGISNTDIGTQPYHRNSLALPEEDGRIRREVVNASKNRSVTTLVRR